jgi:hypothetical protein
LLSAVAGCGSGSMKKRGVELDSIGGPILEVASRADGSGFNGARAAPVGPSLALPASPSEIEVPAGTTVKDQGRIPSMPRDPCCVTP